MRIKLYDHLDSEVERRDGEPTSSSQAQERKTLTDGHRLSGVGTNDDDDGTADDVTEPECPADLRQMETVADELLAAFLEEQEEGGSGGPRQQQQAVGGGRGDAEVNHGDVDGDVVVDAERRRRRLIGATDRTVEEMFLSTRDAAHNNDDDNDTDEAAAEDDAQKAEYDDMRRGVLKVCEEFVRSFLLNQQQTQTPSRATATTSPSPSPSSSSSSADLPPHLQQLAAARESQISKLYQNVTDCDRNLGDMQATLEKYLKRIEAITQGVGSLQKKCTDTESVLGNKTTVQRCVDKALGILLVPP